MYINFQQLAAFGLSIQELAILIAIRQKDEIIVQAADTSIIEKLLSMGLIEELKNKTFRFTGKGTRFVSIIETPCITQEAEETLKELVDIYDRNGKDIGVSLKEAESRIIWFMGNTNFKKSVITSITEEYVYSSGDFTMSLCNFIWKPPSQAFSTHMNLKNSKLFDLIARRYNFNSDIYFDTRKNREMDWLFGVARLPMPPMNASRDYLFTESAKTEKSRIKNIKTYLSNRLKNEVL